jgi:hypothetical protein
LFSNLKLAAQTENFNTWIEVEFKKEFLRDISFSLSPEIRLEDQFKVEGYLFQAKLDYDIFKFPKLFAAYRINTEVKNKGNETYYRWAFDAQLKRDFSLSDFLDFYSVFYLLSIHTIFHECIQNISLENIRVID